MGHSTNFAIKATSQKIYDSSDDVFQFSVTLTLRNAAGVVKTSE